MQYELANGVRVSLYNNTDTAKFLLFVYPRLHSNFVGEVPHMTVNKNIERLILIRNRILDNRIKIMERERARKEIIEAFNSHDVPVDFDDDIPF